MLLINTGFNTPELWALRLDRASGLGGEDRVWRCVRSVPAMSSPTVVDDLLYFLSDSEFVTCLELASGKEVWRERIGGKHYASPLWADGRLYLFGENGKTRLLKPGRTFTLLGENTLAAGCHASPAVSGRALLLRSLSHLYCLETRR